MSPARASRVPPVLALNVEAALPPIRTKCYYQLQKSEHFACGECQYVAKAGHRSPRHNKPPRRYTKVSVWTQSKTAASKAEHRFKLRKLLSRANIPQLDGTLKQRRCHPRRFMRTHQMPYGGSLHLVVSRCAHLLIGVDTHLLTAYAQERSREVLLPPASAPQVRRKPSFTHLLMRPSAVKNKRRRSVSTHAKIGGKLKS